MSEMEAWKGTLIEIYIPEIYTTWEQQVTYLQTLGLHFEDLNIEDEWFYERESDVVRCDGKWYKLLKKEKFDPYDSIFKAIKKEDEEIDFILHYYNGGCCFSEALEEALKNMEEE
jgi:hypothetical protein